MVRVSSYFRFCNDLHCCHDSCMCHSRGKCNTDSSCCRNGRTWSHATRHLWTHWEKQRRAYFLQDDDPVVPAQEEMMMEGGMHSAMGSHAWRPDATQLVGHPGMGMAAGAGAGRGGFSHFGGGDQTGTGGGQFMQQHFNTPSPAPGLWPFRGGDQMQAMNQLLQMQAHTGVAGGAGAMRHGGYPNQQQNPYALHQRGRDAGMAGSQGHSYQAQGQAHGKSPSQDVQAVQGQAMIHAGQRASAFTGGVLQDHSNGSGVSVLQDTGGYNAAFPSGGIPR